ncbi:hypothetical protein Tco_0367105 [Tanacetum coccineum]
MANLEFCRTYNMVAYLKKPEGSEGFHQIVDFLNASHIRYALTENPTIYVSLIKQFWQTATARTLDNGEIELTATIDGIVNNVTEASVRRHLQLVDADGISSLPTTKIFEQLSLMGASKGYTGENIPLFPAMIVQGEGSTHPVESHHIPISAPSTSQPLVSPTSRRTTRQESVVPQPRSPTQTPIADEAASTGVDVRFGGATTTVTGFRAVQKVESLETDLKQTKQIYGAAYTKLIKKVKKLEKIVKSNQARRRARIVVSDDEDDLEDPSKQGRKIAEIDQDPGISLVQHDAEIQGRYGHDMEFNFDFDAAKEVSTIEKDVSTAEPVSTVGAAVTTASVVEDYSKDKELINQRKRYFATQRAEERRNKPPIQAQQRTYMSNYIKHMGGYYHLLQTVRGYSFNEIKIKVNTFVPIESEVDRAVPELAAGSSKKDAEEELDQESSKRQKTGKSSELAEEPRDKEADELSQEELQ